VSRRAPIAPEDCPDPSVHGNPFRYCPVCTWIEEKQTVPQGSLPARLIAAAASGGYPYIEADLRLAAAALSVPTEPKEH